MIHVKTNLELSGGGQMERWVSVRAVSESLGIRTETVLRHIKAGRLLAKRTPGGAYRVRESDLEAYLVPAQDKQKQRRQTELEPSLPWGSTPEESGNGKRRARIEKAR